MYVYFITETWQRESTQVLFGTFRYSENEAPFLPLIRNVKYNDLMLAIYLHLM